MKLKRSMIRRELNVSFLGNKNEWNRFCAVVCSSLW